MTDRLDEKLVIEMTPIDSLKTNGYNPNQQSTHDFQLLVTSMKKDGFTFPIIANRDGRIIDGEHRWRAAQVLGMTQVPVVWKDYTEAEMRVATLRHNRARGEHDVDLEARVLADLEKTLGMAGMEDLLGINAEEMAISLSRVNNAPALEVVAQDLIKDVEAGLAEQGLTGEGLKSVAQRHALVLAKGQMQAEDGQTVSIETGQNYRVELGFDNLQGIFVKKMLSKYPDPKTFIMEVCKFAKAHYQEKQVG